MKHLRPARFSRRPLRVLVTMLAVVAGLLALTPSAASAAVTATITGRVVDASGAPIAGVRVYAAQVRSEPGFAYYEEVGAAVTGSDGRYRIAVKAEESSVAVCTKGDERFVGRCYGKPFGTAEGDPYTPYLTEDRRENPEASGVAVDIAQGTVTTGVSFRLSPPARVRGVVKTVDGDPVVGRTITVRTSTKCADFCREPEASVTTDANGRYDIAITEPVASPDDYCLVVEDGPLRYGTYTTGDFPGYYTCTKSIRTGEVVDVPTTVLPGEIENVETPYWVGTVKVGWTISARPGVWRPSDVTLTYAWFDGTRLLGTGPTYRVKAAELGHRVTLRTTATAPRRSREVVRFTRAERVIAGG